MKTSRLHFSRKVLAYPYMAFLIVFVVTPLVLILINAFVADGQLTFQNFADFFTHHISHLKRSISQHFDIIIVAFQCFVQVAL